MINNILNIDGHDYNISPNINDLRRYMQNILDNEILLTYTKLKNEDVKYLIKGDMLLLESVTNFFTKVPIFDFNHVYHFPNNIDCSFKEFIYEFKKIGCNKFLETNKGVFLTHNFLVLNELLEIRKIEYEQRELEKITRKEKLNKSMKGKSL